MLKLKKILAIAIITILFIGFGMNFSKAEDILSIWSIDTDLSKTIYREDGLHIEGWKLATESNTKMNVYIDGKKLDSKYIRYSIKYDLISIIQGYGTYKENPLPNFDIDIPTEELEIGTHTLKLEFTTEDEKAILKSMEKEIFITRNIKHMLCVDTKLEGQTFGKDGIQIEGWKLATEPNTKLEIKIDGKAVEFTEQDMLLYDLISIIQGYGTYEENPLPNYKINIPTTNIEDGNHKIQINFVTADGIVLETYQRNIIIDKSPKHILCIDTELENAAWYPNGIQINGWKLSTEPNTKIEVYIDNGKIEDLDIQVGYYWDILSVVKGYGTYEENPNPIFTINIPVTQFTSGNHTLKLQFVMEDGTVLEKLEYKLVEYKTRMNIDLPTDRGSITNEEHPVSGWVMTTMPGTEVRLLIDGVYRDEVAIRIQRQDILDYVPNYGGKEINPLPGFVFMVDFSKISLGMHQIVVRVEKDGLILDGQIYYIFVDPKPRYEQGVYGKSGLAVAGDSRGSDLIYYRIGTGPNVLFATFSMHGFEDEWDKDGSELTYIAEQFKNYLLANQDKELEDKWTIYILPCLNPDGQKYGWTNDGGGRTTLYSAAPGNKGVDMNRCWPTAFEPQYNDRNYTGSEPLLAYEAMYLKDFLLSRRSKEGQTVLVDLHGWYNQIIGDEEIGKYYKEELQITKKHTYTYGKGYLINWAKENLGNEYKSARSELVELVPVSNHNQLVSKKYAEKYISATIKMLKGI